MTKDDGKRSAGSKETTENAAEPSSPLPPPRRKTVMRLMAQGERAEKKEQAASEAKENDEPLSKIIPIATAHKLKAIILALSEELPRDISEIRMARLRAPKSTTQAELKNGATVSQAATHAALKALEQWVKLLRPFASGHNLALMISRIVHIKDDGNWSDMEERPLEVIPPMNDPVGAAIRRVVPEPEWLAYGKWEWLEDLLSALSYEESFDRSSFVHRSSTPSGTIRQTGEALAATPGARPSTTGQMPGRRPPSESARIRMSGDFPWDSFQSRSGFRKTATSFTTEKYVRSVPGPAIYSDYDKLLAKPQNPGRGVFHSVGDRRTRCITTPLTQLDRFFAQDFRLE
jgi:hypothetical protein